MRVHNPAEAVNLTALSTESPIPIDINFVRSRLSIPPQLTDPLDMFWYVRTYATGDIAYKLDAGYREAVSQASDKERTILFEALSAVAKHDGCASAMRYRQVSTGWDVAHAAGRLLSASLYGCSGKHCRMALDTLSAALGGKQLSLGGPEVTLDVLFRLVPTAEKHFRDKARLLCSTQSTTASAAGDLERMLEM